MSKRSFLDGTTQAREVRPRFPRAAQLADIFNQTDLIVRDNTEYLAKMRKTSLITRPTQLGKSTLLSLAEMVYSKRKIAPPHVARTVPNEQRNAGYVIRFDFLEVVWSWMDDLSWQENLKRIDSAFSRRIKRNVANFLNLNPELKEFYTEPASDGQAGEHLLELSNAVVNYQEGKNSSEFLMVLVDEYDRPLRQTLFQLLGESGMRSSIIGRCPHYVSFFSCCKLVAQALPGNQVWVTGVVPIVLDLISEFKPENLTFEPQMFDALGLRDEDVERMLKCVQAAEHFSDEEYDRLRDAIRHHANHLQFLNGSPLYHTRMVNELMATALDRMAREQWLRNLEVLPASVTRERAPSAVFRLLKNSSVCRDIAKDLVAKKDIYGTLNENQNLPDVARPDIDKDNYLTLLVHLGIASVHCDNNGTRHIFRSTSHYFRSEYLNELVGATLAPLFDFSSADEIYENKSLLQEFMETLPTSGMSKMIKWANTSKKNRILELQFQGFLVGELHHHFLSDEVRTTQEDKLDSDLRTDVRLRGKSTLLVLELKQKPSVNAPPNKEKMDEYHEQLYGYMEEISEKNEKLVVAGFVVVMYATGTKFLIERTTYGSS